MQKVSPLLMEWGWGREPGPVLGLNSVVRLTKWDHYIIPPFLPVGLGQRHERGSFKGYGWVRGGKTEGNNEWYANFGGLPCHFCLRGILFVPHIVYTPVFVFICACRHTLTHAHVRTHTHPPSHPPTHNVVTLRLARPGSHRLGAVVCTTPAYCILCGRRATGRVRVCCVGGMCAPSELCVQGGPWHTLSPTVHSPGLAAKSMHTHMPVQFVHRGLC